MSWRPAKNPCSQLFAEDSVSYTISLKIRDKINQNDSELSSLIVSIYGDMHGHISEADRTPWVIIGEFV
jgi:hypothetical protein